MGRQPFSTAALRPDLTVQPARDTHELNDRSFTEKMAAVTLATLSQTERRQVEQGIPEGHRRLMHVVPEPNPNVQSAVLDGETVLFDLSTGRSYTLNRLGTAFWEHCTRHEALTDIHAAMCRRFDAPPARIADDLVVLVTQLGHEGLVTIEAR